MEPSARGASDPMADLEALWSALLRQRRAFLLFCGAVLLAAAVVTAFTPRAYQAVAVLQLLPRAGKEVDVDAVVQLDDAGYLERRDHARTQIQVMLSRSVREEAGRRFLAGGGAGWSDAQSVAGYLKDNLEVAPREDTQLVEVKVTHAEPAVAAALANHLCEAYLDGNLDLRRDAAREAGGWIDAQTASYKQAMDDAVERVQAFKQANDVADIEETVDGVSVRLATLNEAYASTVAERVMLEGSAREHERVVERGDAAVLASAFDDPSLAAMSREYAVMMAKSADVLARYGELHPDHQRAREQLDGVRALIEREVARNLAAEKSRLQALRRQEYELQDEIETVKTELLAKDSLASQFLTLRAEEERARALYTSLGERAAEVGLQAQTRLNDVRVVDRALPPGQPSKPNATLNMAVALALGVGGGAALALLRDRRDYKIRTATDASRAFGEVPLLGTIPTLSGQLEPIERALYAAHHPRSRHAEAFRGVRSLLDLPEQASRALMVTSTLEGEGKTDTVIGLAATFARLGAKTLLIDGDLRLPRVHVVFGLPRAPGLADALRDPKRLMRHGNPTEIPGLFVLPSGTGGDDVNELLASPTMAHLLPLLLGLYDVVLIDSPPAAVVNDPLALARTVAGVVVVVRRDRVPPALAADTVAQLKRVGGRVLGVILNDVPVDPSAPYARSRYYDDSEKKPASS